MKFVDHFIRKVSLYKRLLILSLLFLILIFIALNFFIANSFKTYNEMLSFESSQIINSYEFTINKAISSCDAITKFQIIQNAYNESSIYDQLNSTEGYWTVDYTTNSKIMNELKPLYDIDENSVFISVLDNSGKHLYCLKDAVVYHFLQDKINASYIRRAKEKKGALLILNSQEVDSKILPLPENSICGLRSIMTLFPRNSIGTAFCCIDISSAVDYFSLSKRFDSEQIGFFDEQNNLISGYIDTDVAELIRNQSDLELNKLSKKLIKEKNGSWFLYYYTLSERNSICVIQIPYKFVISDVAKSNLKFLILFIILFVFIIVFVISTIFSITTPIKKLSNACDEISQGKFGNFIEDDASDEMSDLINSFNGMSEKIYTLIDEVYKKETLQSQTELQLLRSQISPHFMYNTLETIRARASISNDNDVVEMITIFAKLLRYGVSNTTTLVTVAQVKDYLESYTKLQKIHYQQNFTVTITFSPDIMEIKLLKLLVQPLLENAINHSYSDNTNFQIDIMGYTEYDNLIFKVCDNGKGVSEQEAADINDYINDKNNYYKGIGLKNVNRRIKLYYGEEYGIFFESVQGAGSTVTITIPATKKED